jgi:hypothetical protein
MRISRPVPAFTGIRVSHGVETPFKRDGKDLHEEALFCRIMCEEVNVVPCPVRKVCLQVWMGLLVTGSALAVLHAALGYVCRADRNLPGPLPSQ